MRLSLAQLDAGAQSRDLVPGELPAHPHCVFALEPVARVHHAVGELAVAGEDQQAAGVVVEAAHGEPSRAP